MKFSKKLLSLVLAVVMVFTAVVSVSAAEEINDGTINMKYSVAKASEAPMADGSATYTGDDIYAVSMYAKCKDAISFITYPIQYNKEHFAPIMIYDGTDVYTGTDSYYTDMGEGMCYVYSLDGDYLKNTGMYKANGTTATTKALAKCIGLGNPNATKFSETVEFLSPDHPNYAKWATGLDANIGVMFFSIDDSVIAKNAYLNNTDGIGVNPDWCKMGTVYFQRLAGVTDADCVGDTFGVISDAPEKTLDGVTDTYGQGYFVGATSTITTNPTKHLVENAVVTAEAPALPSVVKSAGQIKMTAKSATEVEDNFQLRITSKITAADWDANFANTAVDGATANYITKVGMVAYTGAADTYSLDDAKAAIAAGASNGDYYYGDTDYIKHADGEDATFGTVLKCTHGSEKLQNNPICLGFVSYVDATGQAQTIYYAETYTAPIVSNYDTLAASYAKNYFGK